MYVCMFVFAYAYTVYVCMYVQNENVKGFPLVFLVYAAAMVFRTPIASVYTGQCDISPVPQGSPVTGRWQK